VNKLEFIKKINEQDLEQVIWFGDKLELGSCLKKIKRTEFEYSILNSARFDYSPTHNCFIYLFIIIIILKKLHLSSSNLSYTHIAIPLQTT